MRVTLVEEIRPVAYTVFGWPVDDIAMSARKLTARGVEFERFEGMDQDEFGIWTVPGGDQVAWFKDPDTNTLSITEFDPRARS